MRIPGHLSPSVYPILGFLSLIIAGTLALEVIPLRQGGHLPLIPSIQDYGIFELIHPRKLSGKALRELDLINQYGVQVIAIRSGVEKELTFIPRGDYIIKENDVMILLGSNQSMDQLLKDTTDE